MSAIRIASFNLENLDDKPGQKPTLDERIVVMRPQLERLNADILCLQEVNGQETAGQKRRLLALEHLVAKTPYSGYNVVSTMTSNDEVYDVRNLVILSRFPIKNHQQYKHDFAPAPEYQKVTAKPTETEAKRISWERPILHAELDLPGNRRMHVINVHLKSKLPSDVSGQKVNNYTWRTPSGWAEGSFISSMKRVGQALETRALIDSIFDQDEDAYVVACGDFNADVNDVPLEAIRGDVENTGNPDHTARVMLPCEFSIPETARYSLFHHGRKNMLDHILASRTLLPFYRGAAVHNEVLHDESVAFATDKKFPESDHAPVVATFEWGA